MTATRTSGLYAGKVTHRRLSPRRHQLRFRNYSLLFDIDELYNLEIPVLSHNRWNLFSIYDRDHGPRDGTALRPWIDSQLRRAGVELDGGQVLMLAFPRILGYTFNPLTIWFCHGKDGSLRAVLYEIHNTFGHSKSHLVPISGIEPHRHGFAKELHVSPFFDREGGYEFTLRPPGDRFSVSIDYHVAGEKALTATMATRRRPLRTSTLLKAFFTHPLLTMRVTIGIHWHALLVWLKGVKYRPVPPPPQDLVTFEGTVKRAL